MNSNSDTPRTDAALPSAIALRDSVLADLARSLKRENARLREALEQHKRDMLAWSENLSQQNPMLAVAMRRVANEARTTLAQS